MNMKLFVLGYQIVNRFKIKQQAVSTYYFCALNMQGICLEEWCSRKVSLLIVMRLHRLSKFVLKRPYSAKYAQRKVEKVTYFGRNSAEIRPSFKQISAEISAEIHRNPHPSTLKNISAEISAVFRFRRKTVSPKNGAKLAND